MRSTLLPAMVECVPLLRVSLIMVRVVLREEELMEPVIVLGGRVGHVAFSLVCTARVEKTGTEKEDEEEEEHEIEREGEGEGEEREGQGECREVELEQMACFRSTGTLTLLSQLLLDKLVNGSEWLRGRLGGQEEGTFVSFVTATFGDPTDRLEEAD